jgi:uncharacterized protein YggE
MKRLWLLTAVVAVASLALAQEHPPRVVKVTGTSDVKVVPDRATIEIGVEKQSASATAAKKAEDAAAREVLAALHASGIDEKDIQTAYLSLEPQYDYKSGRITNFTAEQSITVVLRDLSKLDELLERLVKSGGNKISSVRYETSELRKYRDQARDMAIHAAREKAEALATAVGQSIGKAYLIEEAPQSFNIYAGAFQANSSFEDGRSRAPGPSTAAGQRTVSATVTVWFDLR